MVLLFIEFSNSPTKLPWHIPPDTIIKLQSNKKGTRNLIEKAQDSMNCAAFCDRLSASMQHREIVSHSHAGETILILCQKCISHSGDNNIRGGGGGGQFPCWAWVEGGLVSSCPIFFLNFSLIDYWFHPVILSFFKFCFYLLLISSCHPILADFIGANHNKGWPGPWCEASRGRRGN